MYLIYSKMYAYFDYLNDQNQNRNYRDSQTGTILIN